MWQLGNEELVSISSVKEEATRFSETKVGRRMGFVREVKRDGLVAWSAQKLKAE